MASRPLLLLGNIIAITVTIAAFLQALSWTVAGVLILAALIIPLFVNVSPPRAMTPATSHHLQPEAKPQPKSIEKHTTPSHPLSTKPGTPWTKQPPKTTGPKVATTTITTQNPEPAGTGPTFRLPPVKQGPNFNPTIAKGDYMEYEVELEGGKDFSGEVTATGLVNVYLLDGDNLDNLDEGEEFWSETGEEGVEDAKLEFTAPSKGTWFFVVENADDRPVSATVKIQKGPPPS
jgi:hypothetical protein